MNGDTTQPVKSKIKTKEGLLRPAYMVKPIDAPAPANTISTAMV